MKQAYLMSSIFVTQKIQEFTSQILIGRDFLRESSFAQELLKIGSRFALLMDEKIVSLYRDLLSSHSLDITLFPIPSGEKAKTRETKQKIENALFEAHFGRESVFLIMGGGTVCDLGGFLASTFCRGVPHVFIPTTLMAMVDASIGGKTAVNTPYGKNLIGAFYPPRLIAMDLSCLNTLSENERRAGMAEVIKYGVTLDPELLEISEIDEIVRRSCEIKTKIIGRDFQERGPRRILNFGHTVGHAFEMTMNISHGDAVAVGILIESLMSVEMGYLSEVSFLKILAVIQKQNFPLKLSSSVSLEQLLTKISYDKKGSRFVVLKEIGEVEPSSGSYCTEVKLEILKKALERYATIVG
jgi:3-dehydroquinate synthase